MKNPLQSFSLRYPFQYSVFCAASDVKIGATKIQRALSCDSVISDNETEGEDYEARPRIGQLDFGLTHNR